MESDSLSKFVEAQNLVYDMVLQELRAGRKVTHWMWLAAPGPWAAPEALR